jgi:excinuclease UvrABC ATPase subunit
MLFKSGFLILDEPSNGLTISEVEVFMHTVDHLRDQGIALLVITHDPTIWDADEILQLGVS